MSNLIDRQAAINKILGQPPEPHYPSWYAEQIKELPSAEPKIIRCNDCKYYKYGMCMKICANKSTNGFCDWGERGTE